MRAMSESGKGEMCSICQVVPFKYKCPACFTRTCSVDCCRKHKEKVGRWYVFTKYCNKMPYTYFLPKYDNNTCVQNVHVRFFLFRTIVRESERKQDS